MSAVAAQELALHRKALPGAIPSPDCDEIRRTIDALHDATAIIELRALHKGRKRVDAGCFDGAHRDELVREAARLNAAGAAVYVTMNELDPQLLARYANRIQEFAQATATDSNVTRRRWLLIDVDPQRPKDTSATTQQLEQAKDTTRRVVQHLDGLGWPAPVSAESGNGFHLLYRIDLPNDADSAELIKRCLESLAVRFNDSNTKVDRSVFNAARIIKLHGTVANKGDHVDAAPWRSSRLRRIPEQVEPVPRDLLRALAAEAAPDNKLAVRAVPSSGLRSWTETDVNAFLARGNIAATGPEPHDGAQRWKLKECPFNPDHGPGESAVFLCGDGRLGFECRHDSCQHLHWRDLRTLVDGERPARFEPRMPGNNRLTQDATNNDEAWPAPTPLPDGLPPVRAFDYELLPDTLRARVQDIAERMQCPPDFPAVALVVSLSSIIGRRCAIAPKRSDSWTVFPNLWGMAIGRPGIMKSPPLTEIMRPLQALQNRARESYELEQSEYEKESLLAEGDARVAKDRIHKALKDGNREDAMTAAHGAVSGRRDEPICRRYVVNDSTVEKLGELLNENPTGLLVFRDELAGLFRSLERSGHEADRAFYLECWNGDGSFTYDRIGRGTLHIPGACLSILGSIQPDPLADLMRGARGCGDDGLLQRFQLAVWPDASRNWRNVDRAPDTRAADAVAEIVARLDRLELTDPPRVMRFSDDAQELFDTWRETLETRLRTADAHPMMEAHLSKYRKLVPALALVLHLSETIQGPVTDLALVRAIAWAEFLEPHARRIYAPAISHELDSARALARRIEAGDVSRRFSKRDVYDKGWSGLATQEDVAAAVAVLMDRDWLREEQEATTGRTRTVYVVNPAVGSDQ